MWHFPLNAGLLFVAILAVLAVVLVGALLYAVARAGRPSGVPPLLTQAEVDGQPEPAWCGHVHWQVERRRSRFFLRWPYCKACGLPAARWVD